MNKSKQSTRNPKTHKIVIPAMPIIPEDVLESGKLFNFERASDVFLLSIFIFSVSWAMISSIVMLTNVLLVKQIQGDIYSIGNAGDVEVDICDNVGEVVIVVAGVVVVVSEVVVVSVVVVGGCVVVVSVVVVGGCVVVVSVVVVGGCVVVVASVVVVGGCVVVVSVVVVGGCVVVVSVVVVVGGCVVVVSVVVVVGGCVVVDEDEAVDVVPFLK